MARRLFHKRALADGVPSSVATVAGRSVLCLRQRFGRSRPAARGRSRARVRRWPTRQREWPRLASHAGQGLGLDGDRPAAGSTTVRAGLRVIQATAPIESAGGRSKAD